MKYGADYVAQQLYGCKEPDDTAEQQRNAKDKLYRWNHCTISTLVVFGTGDYGKRVFRMLWSRGIHVDYFIDNDPKKWGVQIEGIICRPVESIQNDRKNTLVIIAAEQFGQMEQQLKSLKFKNVMTKMQLDGILYNVPPWKG